MAGSSTYDKYANDAVNDNIVVCEYIKLAAERYLFMRQDSRFEFRPDIVDRVVRFFGMLKHGTGKHANKPFILSPWQEFCVANIYGFVHPGTNERVCKSAYLEISRKNGKTAFGAGMALYNLIADGESEAEVDFAANSKDQSAIAYKITKTFIKSLKTDRIKLYSDYAIYSSGNTDSQINVFASDDSKLDGYNPSMYLLDEFHAAKNTKMRDVLESGMGMRDNPLSLIITTAGFDKTGPCYQHRSVCVEILRGIKEDWTQFSAIYTLDDGDDWRNPDVWPKASPNMGVTVRREYMDSQCQKARNNPSLEVGFRTKNLNEWMDSETTWINYDYILRATKKVEIDEFRGLQVYAGVDLAAVSDLTAVALLAHNEETNRYKIKVKYYIPSEALCDKYLKEKYREWAQKGLLTVTPGNVTDYDYITNDLMSTYEDVGLQNIGYDSWNSTQWAINATSLGLPLTEYSQSIGNFNRPTRELERLFLAGLVDLDDNEITRFCFQNVVMKTDHNGNCKPNKALAKNKIDGCIAAIQALGIYLETPKYTYSI